MAGVKFGDFKTKKYAKNFADSNFFRMLSGALSTFAQSTRVSNSRNSFEIFPLELRLITCIGKVCKTF